MQSIARLIYALSAGLFVMVLVAGFIQSLRVDQTLPAVDLFGNGARRYIDHLVAHHDIDRAIDQLTMRTRMMPTDADSYEQLGDLWAMSGHPIEARIGFEQLVRLRPEYARGYELLGTTFLDTNEPTPARHCFEQAIKLNPKSAFAYNGMGIAFATIGRMTDAEKCFAKAVELDPRDERARINLDRARSQRRSK